MIKIVTQPPPEQAIYSHMRFDSIKPSTPEISIHVSVEGGQRYPWRAARDIMKDGQKCTWRAVAVDGHKHRVF